MASVTITKKSKNATIKLANAFAYGIFNIASAGKPSSSFTEVLPFRINFTNIGIPAYGVNNVPGIGIAIVGFSNYIL